jgi:hypothetical protein
MVTRFSFGSYGILAIAAFCIFLYASSTIAGLPHIGATLLGIAQFIVVAFVVYMFAKLIMKHF